jgi:type IV pilus assembly protein PilV
MRHSMRLRAHDLIAAKASGGHLATRARHVPLQHATGYALIEILVTLVILLFGLLGLAGVSARANMAEMESYQRVQALMLVQDMTDRINANRVVASCYSNGATSVQLGTSTFTGYTGVPACASGNPQQQTQAVADITAWNTQLQGSAEVNSGSKIGAMIGAVGCVKQLDAANGIYLVSVSWQGMASTVAPTDATGNPCGKNLYSDEKLHRMVTSTIRIGTLT